MSFGRKLVHFSGKEFRKMVKIWHIHPTNLVASFFKYDVVHILSIEWTCSSSLATMANSVTIHSTKFEKSLVTADDPTAAENCPSSNKGPPYLHNNINNNVIIKYVWHVSVPLRLYLSYFCQYYAETQANLPYCQWKVIIVLYKPWLILLNEHPWHMTTAKCLNRYYPVPPLLPPPTTIPECWLF